MRMTVLSGRRGSALLIVLGMLSFMIVSAVAFSMFMRQSRVPSSYLRRTASSRYLLKAALANAIARLDGQLATERQIWGSGSGSSGYCEGILDDSYPGVGPVQGGGSKYDNTGRIYDGDRWVKRVFTPFGPTSPEATVSTLTLEGLAYLPPAIINEARVYSRQTRTAVWRNLAYDAGRYAFCAIDVSDCFDINRLCAGERRFSAPNSRVNLSSLFPEKGASLDSILTKWESSKIPFVSVADYNIMAENSDFAPFYKYIGTSGSDIYKVSDYQFVSNALFITDTWFPPTNSTVAAARRFDLSNLEDARSQPFGGTDYNIQNFVDLDKGGAENFNTLLMKNIGYVGLACLYDYLDRDQYPISLALPTVETVPMICGLGVGFEDGIGGVQFGFNPEYKTIDYKLNDGKYEHGRKRTIARYEFKGLPDLQVSGTAMFPFKHVHKNRKKSFSVEVLAAVFFAASDLEARVSGAALKPTEASWSTETPEYNSDGVIWCAAANVIQPSFGNNITLAEDAVKQFTATVKMPQSLSVPIYYKISDIETTQPNDDDGNQVPKLKEFKDVCTTDGTVENNGPFKVLKKTGEIADWWNAKYKNCGKELLIDAGKLSKRAPDDLAQTVVEFAKEECRPYVALWARVVVDGKTVDLVPATIDDDEMYNKACKYDQDVKSELPKFCGARTPLLDFRGNDDSAFTYDDEGLDKACKNTAKLEFAGWNTLYAVDPRFNFAPEDWFGVKNAAGDASPTQWTDLMANVFGQNGRDPDLFMFTSDQEQLQSIGELAFLPRVQEMTGKVGDPFSAEFADIGRYHGKNDFDSRKPENLGSFANGWCMWQTYTPVGHNGSSERDPIYELENDGTRYEIFSGSGDFRANPFSSDDRVIMAVMKDTPADYYYAGDDKTFNPTAKMDPSERASWAFCANSTVGAKLDDAELADLAEEMRRYFHDYASGKDYVAPWEDAFNQLGWYNNNDTADNQLELFGVELNNPLHAVDRKYLYSFWRECFQNRQQLFLVFVRAEPLTVGGMGEGSLASAQLGARGVALVWRDPQPPTRNVVDRPKRATLTTQDAFKDLYDNYGPHRTRVLFYHQFD